MGLAAHHLFYHGPHSRTHIFPPSAPSLFIGTRRPESPPPTSVVRKHHKFFKRPPSLLCLIRFVSHNAWTPYMQRVEPAKSLIHEHTHACTQTNVRHTKIHTTLTTTQPVPWQQGQKSAPLPLTSFCHYPRPRSCSCGHGRSHLGRALIFPSCLPPSLPHRPQSPAPPPRLCRSVL